MTPFIMITAGIKMIDKYIENIDQTRKVLELLPVVYLNSYESVYEYVSNMINIKN